MGPLLELTPDERKAIALLVLVLLIGTVWDLTRARSMRRQAPSAASQVLEPGSLPPPAAGLDIPRADSAAGRDTRIDLNRAGVAELDALPGIGPVLAGRIVEFRQRHGPFRSIEELRAVRGLGPRLLERLGPHLTVLDPGPGPADSTR